MKMKKAFLVSVIATGCLSRFRNGEQFTQTAKQIEVDDSELAVLEADSYLQVKVISQQADNLGVGATDDDASKGTAVSSVVTSLSEDVPLDDTITLSAKAGVIIDELENKPTPKAATDTDTTAPLEPITSESESAAVSKAPVNHLDTIVDAMRGLDLDLTANKPSVYELKELGLDISAKERDAAWDALVK